MRGRRGTAVRPALTAGAVIALCASGCAAPGETSRSVGGCTYTVAAAPVGVHDSGDLPWVVGGSVKVVCDPRPDQHVFEAALQRKRGDSWVFLPHSQYEVTPRIKADDPDEVATAKGTSYGVSAECDPGTYRIRYTATVTRQGRSHSTGTVFSSPVTIKECSA
ncbi:hypothetical protein [Streptomyces sp. NPDC054786]